MLWNLVRVFTFYYLSLGYDCQFTICIYFFVKSFLAETL